MRVIFLIISLLYLCVLPAKAADQPVSITFLNGRYDTGSRISYFGLRVGLDHGWHTYWKSPGAGGLPPELKVIRAANVKDLHLLWPAPQIIRSLGENVAGYSAEVVFPVAVTAIDPARPVELSMGITVYACSNICVPFNEIVAGSSRPGITPTSVGLVDSWVGKVPMRMEPVAASLDRNSGSLAVDGSAVGMGDYSQLFLDSGANFSAQPIYGSKSGNAAFAVRDFDNKGFDALGTPNLVVVDDGKAREYPIVVTAPTRLSWMLIGTALLAGFILNLMPCVLPVLSLKLLSLTKGAGRVRSGFLWSALGIWTSFVALAVVLLSLRSLGLSVGWGVQFQNPYFLAVMAAATTLFAVSMVDGVVLYLPVPLAGFVGRLASGHGKLGSFLQGFVATLLATPCSAPFVGTAVGFALGASPVDLVSVFVAMGLGMALPYLLIAAVPFLHRLVPKPGKWMTAFKTTLAISMAGTSGYLTSVVIATTSGEAGAVLIILLLFATRLLVRSRLLFLLLAASLLFMPVHDYLSEGDASQSKLWQPFDPASIPTLVAAGKTVVVDVTAKWCVTCKVNDQTVWTRQDVVSALSSVGVLAMRADWTKPDKRIAQFLKGFNRYGLPFNVVYSPENPAGIILPELLSRMDILDALPSKRK